MKKINYQIKELKRKISELTDKINDQWTKELSNYKAKDDKGDYYYINGAWEAFKSKNADCQEREKLERELKAITPAPTIKERLKKEQTYMKSAGLLRTAEQRRQWRLTKQGLINMDALWRKKERGEEEEEAEA